MRNEGSEVTGSGPRPKTRSKDLQRGSMCMFCITDACEPFRYRLCPNSMPGNSRKDSEHKKQHWNRSLCAIRLPSRLPHSVSEFGNEGYGNEDPETEARCDFEDIPAGTYAIAAIHDENRNGKLDMNWLGVPKEGYGCRTMQKPWLAHRHFLPPASPTTDRTWI